MQYISLKDDISKLNLDVRLLNALKRNGVNTVCDLIQNKEEDFMESISEVKHIVKSLYSGEDGIKLMPETDIIQELSTAYNLDAAECKKLVEKNQELRSKLISLLQKGNMTLEEINNNLPKHLQNTDVVKNLLLDMKVKTTGTMYGLSSIVDYINSIPDDKNRQIMLDRLNGQTLAEIGDGLGLTRERIRQICVMIFREARNQYFREEKYADLFSKYKVCRRDFKVFFNEPPSTYEYLKATVPVVHSRKSLELAVLDESISEDIRQRLKICHGHVLVNGQVISSKWSSLVDYYIKTYCREITNFDDFKRDYSQFVKELGLKDLGFDWRSCVNYLYSNMSVLCSQWRRFRYYDIQSRDYSELLEKINLKQYAGLRISTRKIFNENMELMEQYDIQSEYELHNLLRKIWDKTDKQVVFEKMTSIRVEQ